MSFIAVEGDQASPCLLHVPHASTDIPPHIRRAILLDDRALRRELVAMTDAHTDQIAASGGDRPRAAALVVRQPVVASRRRS
jgi:N-formylglutamate deformylase